jgi:hypothetical protein
MAIYSNPSFPILASDQADVIRLFIDLMRDANRTSGAPQLVATNPVTPQKKIDGARLPNELLDLD